MFSLTQLCEYTILGMGMMLCPFYMPCFSVFLKGGAIGLALSLGPCVHVFRPDWLVSLRVVGCLIAVA